MPQPDPVYRPRFCEMIGRSERPSGLGLGVGHVTAVNWGYEVWGGNQNGSNCVDVAIHFLDENGGGVILVEAKRPGGKLKKSDLDPGSYLNLKSFAFTKRRALLYLVGDKDVEPVKGKISDTGEHHWAVLGWQELAGLQIGLAQQLPVDPVFRQFIASAIQYQFAQHCLWPSQLSTDYLGAEPKLEPKLCKADWESQEWKLPEKP